MEPENDPKENPTEESPEKEDDLPVIRLVKETPEPKKFSASSPNTAELPHRLEVPTVEIPRVARSGEAVHEPLAPRPENEERAEKIWGQAEQNPLPWPKIIIGVVLGLCMIFGGILLYSGQRKIDAVRAEKQRPTAPSQLPAAAVDGPSEVDAEKLITSIETAIHRYAAATTVDEQAKYIRQPERVVPLMRDYYPDRKITPFKISRLQLDPLTLQKRADFWAATAYVPSGTPRSLIVEVKNDGTALVDWEVDVVYQPYSWKEFTREKPTGQSHDFRVHISNSNLYSHEFADERKWQVFLLNELDNETYLYGYCEAGGPIAKKLAALIYANNGTPIPVILRLQRPIGLASPQGAVIEAITSENWIYTE